MSLIPLCRRVCTARVLPAIRTVPVQFSRFNSTKVAAESDKKFNLLTQIYPINNDTVTEEDVDEWLKAVKKLKANNNTTVDTAEEVYLQELTKVEPYLEETFEPTEEQVQQVEEMNKAPIPLYTHPIVENVVCLMMRDGKKSRAQKIVARALYMIALKTRKDPVQILTETLDKLGPLMATRTEKTGTAKNKLVPYPLNQRQRNRYAILWIFDGAKKKKSKDYSVRLAEEILSAYEGKSSGYDRKAQMHKAAIAQRAFIRF
ncbi:37S ribosomal protein S7, mitochondrial [[Candida] anglica]|uniref:37S ribosomal protein S7, mitochondrial n=1 Tax=[Candida] anglica TaxID=148631 RepID=A0ABP0EFZ0_9ASCO